MSSKDKKNTKEVKTDYTSLMHAMEEATKLSITFVIFPVIFLLLGVFLDKKFNTVPVFILIGIIIGFVIFSYEAYRAMQKIKKNK